MFGCILLMNLFLGVIFFNFTFSRGTLDHKHLTDSQQMWIQLVRQVARTSPYDDKKTIEKSYISNFCMKLQSGHILRTFVLFVTSANLLFLVVSPSNQNQTFLSLLDILNVTTIMLNLIEAVIKIFADGPKNFFQDPWQIFDFSMIILTSIELVPKALSLDPQFSEPFSALRVFRVFRFLVLLPKESGVKKLFITLAYSLPIVLNLFVLLVLVLFLYAMAGCTFFSQIKSKNNSVNFTNFYSAMFTLLKVATADDWVSIMFEVRAEFGKLPI